MKVTIENNEVVIRVPIAEKPQLSASGKSYLLYTSSGVIKTTTEHQGKPISVGLNVMVSARKQLGGEL